MAISQSDSKSAPEVKAVSVSSYYYYSTMKTKISVSYSIDDEPKVTDQIDFTDELLADSPEKLHNLILKSFGMIWMDKHPQVYKQLMAYLHSSLTKEYQDSKHWSTKFGGEHNKSKYHSVDGTPVEDSGFGFINGKSVDMLSYKLPAIDAIVPYPCKNDCACGYVEKSGSLREIIMHLNDLDKWSREAIADWIDELHDKGLINAEFQVPDNRTDEQKIKYDESLDYWKKLGYTMDVLLVATETTAAAFDSLSQPLAEWEKELLNGNQDKE